MHANSLIDTSEMQRITNEKNLLQVFKNIIIIGIEGVLKDSKN